MREQSFDSTDEKKNSDCKIWWVAIIPWFYRATFFHHISFKEMWNSLWCRWQMSPQLYHLHSVKTMVTIRIGRANQWVVLRPLLKSDELWVGHAEGHSTIWAIWPTHECLNVASPAYRRRHLNLLLWIPLKKSRSRRQKQLTGSMNVFCERQRHMWWNHFGKVHILA